MSFLTDQIDAQLSAFATVVGNDMQTIEAELSAHKLDENNPHNLDKSDLGLDQVDNTSDINKPISNAVANALAGKVDNERVLTDVPAGALFTDSIYDETAVNSHMADNNKHLSTDERAAINNTTNTPNASNPFATKNDLDEHKNNSDVHLSSAQNNALDYANNPSETNPIATIDDLAAATGGGSADESERVVFTVTNSGPAKLYKGSVVSPDENHEIVLADPCSKRNSRLIAMLDEDLDPGASGKAVKLGSVEGIDTSGFSPGEIAHLGLNGTLIKNPYTTLSHGCYHVVVGVIDTVDAVSGSITIDSRADSHTMEITDTNGFHTDQVDNVDLNYVNATRTFTVTKVADYHYYVQGDKFSQITDRSVIWPDVEAQMWVYFDSTGLQVVSDPTKAQLVNIITKYALVSYFHWDFDNKKVVFDIFDELHGLMPPIVHSYFHRHFGALFNEGAALGNITLGNGSLDVDAQYSIEAGSFDDEDREHVTPVINVGDTVSVGYLDGAAGNPRSEEQTGFAILNDPVTGRLYYNHWNGTTWERLPADSGNFVCYHDYLINGRNKQNISLMGQHQYTNAALARAGAPGEAASLRVSFEAEEAILIGTRIYETKDSYGNAVKSRIVEDDEGHPYIDWRTTPLAAGVQPTDHQTLTNIKTAAIGVLHGHLDEDQYYQLTTGIPITIAELTALGTRAAGQKYDIAEYGTVTLLHADVFQYYDQATTTIKTYRF